LVEGSNTWAKSFTRPCGVGKGSWAPAGRPRVTSSTMIFAQVCPPRGSRGALVRGLEAYPEGLNGLREPFVILPFRQKGHHRRVQPSGGCLIAAEWFQRIANLAFHPALSERQQDPPCFLYGSSRIGTGQTLLASRGGGVRHSHHEA
jgi:hypothetical protein